VSAADPSQLGTYDLSLTGKGKEIRGKLDPFNSDRDGFNDATTIDLTAENPGWYKIELWENLHGGLLILRDQGNREIARDDGSGARDGSSSANLSLTSNVGSGTYHVLVEDDFNGGDWRLVITYLGPPGQ
jgi:hypothetical protein